MGNRYSNYPSTSDVLKTLPEYRDLRPEDKIKMAIFDDLIKKDNLTSAQLIQVETLLSELRDVMVTSEDYNKIVGAIINLENYFKNVVLIDISDRVNEALAKVEEKVTSATATIDEAINAGIPKIEEHINDLITNPSNAVAIGHPRNQFVINKETNTIAIGIHGFNANTDVLTLHVGGSQYYEYKDGNGDYTIDSSNNTITLVGDKKFYVGEMVLIEVAKNILTNIPTMNTDLVKDNSILRVKLDKDTQDVINSVPKLNTNSERKTVEGEYISTDSFDGMTEGLQIKGRTLQNLIKNINWTIDSSGIQAHMNVDWSLLKPNTLYTYIVYNPSSKINLNKGYVGVNFTKIDNHDISKPVLLTTVSDLNIVGTKSPHIYPKTGETFIDSDLLNTKIMLFEGDWTGKAIPPYFEGIRSVEENGEKLEVVSCGKNLFNIKKIATLNSKLSYDNGLVITQAWGNCVVDNLLRLKPNTKYTISGTINIIQKATGTIADTSTRLYLMMDKTYSGSAIAVYSYTNTHLLNVGDNINISQTFTTPSNIQGYKYLSFYSLQGTTAGIVKLIDIQIEEGTVPTPYEPYKEHRQLIPASDLKGLPNGVTDVVDFNSKKVIRNVGKITFNGSEDWISVISGDKQHLYLPVLDCVSSVGVPLICDRFTLGSNNWLKDSHGTVTTSSVNRGQIGFTLNLDAYTIDTWKAWLKDNPVTVYYPLATPVEEKISLSQLQTFEPKTNIFTTGSLISPTISCSVPSNKSGIVGDLKKAKTINKSNTVAMVNEVYDKTTVLDEQLGDMTQVPTTSKTASGAITELFTDVVNSKNDIKPIKDQLKRESGNYIDNTTQIDAGATYTKTIPLSFNAKRGRAVVNGSRGSGVVYFGNTNDSAVSFSWNGNLNNCFSSKAPILIRYVNAGTGIGIELQRMYIENNNLIIIFKNEGSGKGTMGLQHLEWEVEG